MDPIIKKNPRRRKNEEIQPKVSDELKQLAVKHETEVEQPSVYLKYFLPIGLAATGLFLYTTRPVEKPMPIEKPKPDPKPKPKPKKRIF